MATGMIPAWWAVRSASAVGADTAATTGGTENGGLLDHFHRNAARQQDRALRRGYRVAGQRAGKLVQSVVPADIFAQRDNAAVGLPESRGMHGVALAVQRLQGGQGCHRGRQLAGRHTERRGHARRRAHGRGEAFETAQAATGGAGDVSAAVRKCRDPCLAEPQPELDTLGGRNDLDIFDLVAP